LRNTVSKGITSNQTVSKETALKETALKRILVPVDGSPAAGRVLEVAVALARRCGSELVLGNAVNYAAAIAQSAEPYGVTDAEPLMKALENEAHGILSQAETTVKAAGLGVTSVVLEGPASSAIVNYSAEHGIDAIVMGTRGIGGLERFFVGSTADGVLRGTEVPVFVVQPAVDAAPLAFERILVATDDSEASAAAVTFSIDLAKGMGGATLFCHVIARSKLGDTSREYAYDPKPLLEEARAAARPALDRAMAQAASRGLRAETYVVEGDTVDEILLAASAHKADVIAIGTHGRRGLERLFLGSVAEAVVRRSPIPVVVVRR
jgi:nucleotide-binding universal stress UspA family protein